MVSNNLTNERLGEKGFNNQGSLMEVVVYNKYNDIWVKFSEHGNLIHTTWQQFSKGEVRNPFDKSVLGIGYLGEGSYKSNVNKSPTIQYQTWMDMLKRCYSNNSQKKNPAYVGSKVDEEWHNYQNFAKWYDENYYELEGERMNLDKDILIKGNKCYSPNTCIFVPQRINILFSKIKSNNNTIPLGVSRQIKNYKVYYKAQCHDGKQNIYIGLYDTPEKAFIAYKTFKENIIKKTAEEYRNKIPCILFEAMINYRILITD